MRHYHDYSSKILRSNKRGKIDSDIHAIGYYDLISEMATMVCECINEIDVKPETLWSTIRSLGYCSDEQETLMEEFRDLQFKCVANVALCWDDRDSTLSENIVAFCRINKKQLNTVQKTLHSVIHSHLRLYK